MSAALTKNQRRKTTRHVTETERARGWAEKCGLGLGRFGSGNRTARAVAGPLRGEPPRPHTLIIVRRSVARDAGDVSLAPHHRKPARAGVATVARELRRPHRTRRRVAADGGREPPLRVVMRVVRVSSQPPPVREAPPVGRGDVRERRERRAVLRGDVRDRVADRAEARERNAPGKTGAGDDK